MGLASFNKNRREKNIQQEIKQEEIITVAEAKIEAEITPTVKQKTNRNKFNKELDTDVG
jgi:hypothetical protein